MTNRSLIKRVNSAQRLLQRILDDDANKLPLEQGHLRLAIMDLMAANDYMNQT